MRSKAVIGAILERNKRVEIDKAWEMSITRRAIITLMTYVIIVVFLFVIHAPYPWLSALVPVVGFILSTLTLPVFKEWWMQDIYKR